MIRSLVIATPCAGGKMHAPYCLSLVQAGGALSGAGIQWGVDFDHVGWTASARNRQVARAKKMGCDVLFFIDNDMVFTPSDILTVLETFDDPLVHGAGVFYPRKYLNLRAGLEYLGSLKEGDEPDAKGFHDIVQRGTWKHQELGPGPGKGARGRVQVDWLPTGFLALRMSAMCDIAGAFDRYVEPERAFGMGGGTLEVVEYFSHPIQDVDGERRLMGEDTSFGPRARAAGMKLWKVLGVEVGHIGGWLF